MDVIAFIDCLIVQEGKAKERRKKEKGKKRRSGRSGVLIENLESDESAWNLPNNICGKFHAHARDFSEVLQGVCGKF